MGKGMGRIFVRLTDAPSIKSTVFPGWKLTLLYKNLPDLITRSGKSVEWCENADRIEPCQASLQTCRSDRPSGGRAPRSGNHNVRHLGAKYDELPNVAFLTEGAGFSSRADMSRTGEANLPGRRTGTADVAVGHGCVGSASSAPDRDRGRSRGGARGDAVACDGTIGRITGRGRCHGTACSGSNGGSNGHIRNEGRSCSRSAQRRSGRIGRFYRGRFVDIADKRNLTSAIKTESWSLVTHASDEIGIRVPHVAAARADIDDAIDARCRRGRTATLLSGLRIGGGVGDTGDDSHLRTGHAERHTDVGDALVVPDIRGLCPKNASVELNIGTYTGGGKLTTGASIANRKAIEPDTVGHRRHGLVNAIIAIGQDAVIAERSPIPSHQLAAGHQDHGRENRKEFLHMVKFLKVVAAGGKPLFERFSIANARFICAESHFLKSYPPKLKGSFFRREILWRQALVAALC